MTLHRAFTLLTTKSVSESRRVITGMASTPTPDRALDVVEPLGARFKTPMPLLLYHDSQRPVGTMDFAKPTKTGIPFEASLPDVTEAGVVQERVREAWHGLKYKLIAAVSIGFRPLEGGAELMKNGGIRWTAWEWLELSLCTVPMNPEAVVQSFRSKDVSAIHRALHTRPAGDTAERTALISRLRSPRSTPARGGGPGTADYERLKRHSDRVIREAIMTDPALRVTRDRVLRREAAARTAKLEREERRQPDRSRFWIPE